MAITMGSLKVQLNITGSQTNDAELDAVVAKLNQVWTWTFAEGATANAIDRFWTDTRTLAATTAENLDLAGALTHVFGTTIAAARIKLIAVRHKTAAASAALQVGGHATLGTLIFGATPDLDTAQPYLIVPAGGGALWVGPTAAGVVVTAGTDDMLRIYNGGAASVDYDIIIGYCLT